MDNLYQNKDKQSHSQKMKAAWARGCFENRSTDDYRHKLSKIAQERQYSEETRQRMSEAARKRVGEKANNWRGGKIRKICEICGRVFMVFPSQAKMTCSDECYGKWCSKNRQGKSNPSWRGGKSFEPYPPTFNEQFKQAIRKRDNYICAICRMTGRNIHHINYVKEDTVPENCITLCHPCHSITNGNREYWQAALTDIMEVREISYIKDN